VILDNYAPSPAKTPRGVYSVLADKIEAKQANSFVVNLDDSPLTIDALRQQFDMYPLTGLDEVIFLRNGQIIGTFGGQ